MYPPFSGAYMDTPTQLDGVYVLPKFTPYIRVRLIALPVSTLSERRYYLWALIYGCQPEFAK